MTAASRGCQPKIARRIGLGCVVVRSDRCLRCGVALPPGMSVCRRCNPANLPAPSSSQSHATVYLSVLLAIALVGMLIALKG